MHSTAHPLAGETVAVKLTGHPQIGEGPHEYKLLDWWDKLTGGSWMFADGNPAALIYAMRSGMNEMPLDNEVVYGHIGGFGHIVHVTEIIE